MFKHYFEQVENVAVWPIISLSIFFLFFVGLIIYVSKIRKEHVKHMEDMPLKDGQTNVHYHNEFKNL